MLRCPRDTVCKCGPLLHSAVSHLLLFSRVETASEWHEDVIDILDAGDVDIYKAHRILVEWA